MAFRSLSRADSKISNHQAADNGTYIEAPNVIHFIINDEGYMSDTPRILTHPGFDAVEGEGIYTYDKNPDITKGFIYSPATIVETAVQKTLRGSIVVQQRQNDDDAIIQEIWQGGENQLSMLAEMFQVFYKFWTEIPAPGLFLVWQPADITTVSYGVLITDVQLGGDANILAYREHPVTVGERSGSYIFETLTVTYKVVSEYIAPRGVVTLEGL